MAPAIHDRGDRSSGSVRSRGLQTGQKTPTARRRWLPGQYSSLTRGQWCMVARSAQPFAENKLLDRIDARRLDLGRLPSGGSPPITKTCLPTRVSGMPGTEFLRVRFSVPDVFLRLSPFRTRVHCRFLRSAPN